MTLIVGKHCTDGVVLAADRRELRGLVTNETGKIRRIRFNMEKVETSVLLAGAGVGAFWDETAWSVEQFLTTETDPKVNTLLDVVSLISSIATNLSARYQRGGMDEKLGCVLAGLDNLNSGNAKIYYFAGAGFSETEFICLGSGDAYALSLADVLLNTGDITLEKAARFLPLIFLLVERVTVSVANGPDIFTVKDGEKPLQTDPREVKKSREKADLAIANLPELLGNVVDL